MTIKSKYVMIEYIIKVPKQLGEWEHCHTSLKSLRRVFIWSKQ